MTDQKTQQYELNEPITSCLVDKPLLVELEKYFVEKLPSLLGLSDAAVRDKLRFTIIERRGNEVFRSTTDYASSEFAESVVGIELQIYTTNTWVQVVFDESRSRSHVHIRHSGIAARQSAVGAYVGIREIIHRHQNWYWLFHPHDALTIAIGVGTIFTAVQLLFAVLPWTLGLLYPGIVRGILVAAFALFASFWVGCWMLPYTTFASQRTRTRSSAAFKIMWLCAGGGLLTSATTALWDAVRAWVWAGK